MKNKFGPCFLIVPLFFIGVLAGCVPPQPTEAQNRMDAYVQSMGAATGRFNICMWFALRNAAYVAVKNHFAMPSDHPTDEQLSDETMPTKEDIANLRKFFPMQKKCRSDLTNEMESFSPMDAAFYKKEFADVDAILMELIEQKITWGESVRRRREIATNIYAKHGEVRDRIAADWKKMHKNELRQRRMGAESPEQ